jgi:hypothetical protein
MKFHENECLHNFYEDIITRTIDAKKHLKNVEEAFEKDNKFLLVTRREDYRDLREKVKLGLMIYTYGMLIIVRKDERPVFHADTKAICGIYYQEGVRVVPYLGVNKGYINFEVAKILTEHQINFDVDKDTEAFAGPNECT